MSNHNYSQYSSKKPHNNQHHNQNKPKSATKVTNAPEVELPKVIQPAMVQETTSVVRPALFNETVETVSLPKTVEGVVAGCAKLNVRAEPNLFAEIICVLDVSSEMAIDVENSDSEWFKICTATGIEGYCMRKFVEACL